MPIEIPNFFEAGGLFDGLRDPVTADSIVSQEGFQPYDPLTSPSVPLGGFTKTAVGRYALQLVQQIDGAEGGVFVSKFFVAPIPNTTIPAGNIFQDGTVGVADSNPNGDAPMDFTFYVAILRWKYGPNVTASRP